MFIQRNIRNLTCLKRNNERFFVIPLEAGDLAVALVELNELMLLRLGIKLNDLLASNDAAHQLIVVILKRAPSDVRGLTFDNVTIERSVSLMI